NVGATELLPESDLAASLIKALFALRCKKAKDARKKPFDSTSFSAVQEREFVTFAKKALTDFPEIAHALEHTKEPSKVIDAYKKAVRDIFMKHPDTLRSETNQLFKKALLAHAHALFRQAHSLPKIEKDTPLYTTSQLDTAIHLATAYFPKEPHTYVYSIMMGRPIDCTQKDFPIPNTYTLTKTDTSFTIERRRVSCATQQ
ncbi:MAG: hypothetical protein KDK65_05560, partial [Chlamydiia bacterium]|nr:hypothetical protein [Chlamydiia bacterium]